MEHGSFAILHSVLNDNFFSKYQERETEVSVYKEKTMLAVSKITVTRAQDARTPLLLDEAAVVSGSSRFMPLDGMHPGKLLEDVMVKEWNIWKTKFNTFMCTGTVNNKDLGDKMRVQYLMSSMDQWWTLRTQATIGVDSTGSRCG